MLRGRLPTPNEAKMLDALLVILVEHGMVSQVVAARLVYHCAPEAIQAAVAAALCGAGSVHRGSSEWSAKMLTEALPPESKDPDLARVANAIFENYSAKNNACRGLAIALMPKATPAPRLSSGSPKIIYGKYCELLQKLSTVVTDRRKRLIPVNVIGAIAAIALDMGFPWRITKAFALIGCTVGVMGHIAEEIRNPMATQIDAAIKQAIVYEPYRT